MRPKTTSSDYPCGPTPFANLAKSGLRARKQNFGQPLRGVTDHHNLPIDIAGPPLIRGGTRVLLALTRFVSFW